ncbi:Tryptophan synthase beta subunit-like PLP-dependent enzymes superfamily [Pseudocohnilembus persalinus]|uniref:cystathionine beta-synthase n=1 Tax=Pseudocohnilembus persalinus TaxID=266149 RepID=A0A0V0QMB6_PSEPJ|nr:Tryptophan synthase beta subunit-like PLP-dependent enzymes superfamily [Pseudocohnilembus persalinus]|eukprot:KRX03357.1 Tryptophan synthase beta subunit-like PLP-dependent enzymes superfamily [Pseudocohnilembus persalinus]
MYKRQDPALETNKCPYHEQKGKQEDPHFHRPLNFERKKIYDNVLEVIGNTPVIRLNRIPQSEDIKCQMFVKAEFLNPGGSLKDRIGERMVVEAERKGDLKEGDVLIEATSGNTGIGLSMAAAVKGYGMHITMPEKMSNEKVNVLRALGAQIYKTPTEAAFDDEDSHINKALNLQKELPNSKILDQYRHLGNPLSHYDGTGAELVHQFDGQLDYIFVGTGTGGTITGIGRKIKELMPKCKVIGVDPHGSILAMPQTLNTVEGGVLMEGIGYDFVPEVIDRKVVDDWHKIDDQTALPMSRRLIREEGLLVGGTSGATVGGAIQYLKAKGLDQNPDLKVCCLCADNIRNYITKLACPYYMYEHGLMKASELVEKNHPLNGKSLDELNLKQVQNLTEQSTIQDCLNLFKKGFTGLPVYVRGEKFPSRGVLQSKMMECIVNKNLKTTDLVTKCWTQDFSSLHYEDMDQALLQRFLERRPVCLIVKLVDDEPVTYHAQPMDILTKVTQN